MPSHKQNQWRKFVWIVCLIITSVLCFYSYLSPRWVENTDEDVQIGVARECRGSSCRDVGMSGQGHGAWRATLVMFGFTLAFILLSTVCAIISFFWQKDRVLFVAKKSGALGSLFMFICLLIWPVGLDNDRLKCGSSSLDTQVYHMCDPWDVGMGMYIMIVAMIFLTFSVCIGSLVTSKTANREADKRKKEANKKRDSKWYDPKNPAAVAAAASSSEDDKKGSVRDRKKGDKKGDKGKVDSNDISLYDQPVAKTTTLGRSKSKSSSVAPIAEAPEGETKRSSSNSSVHAPIEEDIDYLIIENKGRDAWSQPASGTASLTNNTANSVSFFNPMFDDMNLLTGEDDIPAPAAAAAAAPAPAPVAHQEPSVSFYNPMFDQEESYFNPE